MASSNGSSDLEQTLGMFHEFDTRRQQFVEELVQKYTAAQSNVTNMASDLDVEREVRRGFKKRAEEAEEAIARSQFVLVLVDGDGYIFKNDYLTADAGGAQAAHDLVTEIQQYCRSSGLSGSFDVMVNVYANKSGLARTLCSANVIDHSEQLDGFWTSFCQSHALAHFIDCGYGKERADSKIRDTYRFYAQNPTVRKVVLALCHDSGYAAELDKYRHDPIVAPKTVLVQPPLLNQMPRAYAGLPFSNLKMSCFETSPIEPRPRSAIYATQREPESNETNTLAQRLKFPTSSVSDNTQSTPRTTPLPPANVVASPIPSKAEVALPTSRPKSIRSDTPNGPPDPPISGPTVPLNRHNQRIDRKMNAPNQSESRRFDQRIETLKLCNEHHLRAGCFKGNRCPYDHSPIDAQMLQTLRWKARSLPCPDGSECRAADCYFGHHCPWECTQQGCNFRKAGMHKVTDLDIVKVVPAVVY